MKLANPFRRVEDLISYKFELISISDWQAVLKINNKYLIESTVFEKIFNQAKIKLKRERSISAEGDISNIEKFPLDERFYNYVLTGMKSQVNELKKEVSKDGIEILNVSVQKGEFERIGEKWGFEIRIGGQYGDRRN